MSNNKNQESVNNKSNSSEKTETLKKEKIITNSLSSFVRTKPSSSKPNQKSK